MIVQPVLLIPRLRRGEPSGIADILKSVPLPPATPHNVQAASVSAARRSSSARLIFSAADLSWPQAAMMSRLRGVRTGPEIPALKIRSEKRALRASAQHLI